MAGCDRADIDVRGQIQEVGMRIYRCEDSLEGIFTGIYRAYEDHSDPKETELSLDEDPRLFAEEVQVVPDREKSKKVVRTLCRRFGEADYMGLCHALASRDDGRAQAVYRTVAQGLARNVAVGHLFDNLADDGVLRAFKLSQNVSRESQHLKGFLRFEELKGGVLYAKIHPGNHVLPFVMEHFADRFPQENFLIYDVGRELFGVHRRLGTWNLMQDSTGTLIREVEGVSRSPSEAEISELFRRFCHTITIEARQNPKLQRNMLPLHFREYMTEF